MASASMTVAPITVSQKPQLRRSAAAFLSPVPVRPSKAASLNQTSGKKLRVSASLKEKAITGLTAAALTASMVVPDVAEAAVSPSLKNFLLSIVAGGVVLAAILGAIIGVSNFDPVKRT